MATMRNIFPFAVILMASHVRCKRRTLLRSMLVIAATAFIAAAAQGQTVVLILNSEELRNAVFEKTRYNVHFKVENGSIEMPEKRSESKRLEHFLPLLGNSDVKVLVGKRKQLGDRIGDPQYILEIEAGPIKIGYLSSKKGVMVEMKNVVEIKRIIGKANKSYFGTYIDFRYRLSIPSKSSFSIKGTAFGKGRASTLGKGSTVEIPQGLGFRTECYQKGLTSVTARLTSQILKTISLNTKPTVLDGSVIAKSVARASFPNPLFIELKYRSGRNGFYAYRHFELLPYAPTAITLTIGDSVNRRQLMRRRDLVKINTVRFSRPGKWTNSAIEKLKKNVEWPGFVYLSKSPKTRAEIVRGRVTKKVAVSLFIEKMDKGSFVGRLKFEAPIDAKCKIRGYVRHEKVEFYLTEVVPPKTSKHPFFRNVHFVGKLGKQENSFSGTWSYGDQRVNPFDKIDARLRFPYK